LAVGLGLLLLGWVASSEPVTIIGGGRPPAPPPDQPPPTPSESASGSPTLRELVGERAPGAIDLSWVGDTLAIVILGCVLVGVLLACRWAVRHRWHPPEKVIVEEFSVLPEAGALSAALARDVEAQFEAVMEGSPRNGIVECWLRLEMVITDVGLPPYTWETSAEFTVRVLQRLDLDPRAIATLSGLYREARFSDHELGEDDRVAARSALRRLHSDLQERASGLRGGQV